MIVFGVTRSSGAGYAKFAESGLRRILEPDSVVMIKEGASSISAAYNEILDATCRDHPDAEAVVLLHQDLEILDAEFYAKVRSKLEDGTVGLIGVIGARDVRSIVYWRATIVGYVEEGSRTLDFGRGCHEVDAIDGMLMILGPQTFRALRFDEDVARGFHGYDIDFSSQVRASDLRVIVDDLEVVHHTKGGYGDRRGYLSASRAWRRKWLRHTPTKVIVASWMDDLHVLFRRDKFRIRTFLRRAWRKIHPA